MGFLLDTNIISELRKGERAVRRVKNWYDGRMLSEIFLSVLVLGEIRQGVERIRLRDTSTARVLENWLYEVEAAFEGRILPITAEICQVWGRLSPLQVISPIDGLLAATALHHRLTLVTRNKRDVARSGADCFNPFGE